jgi:hypothetical protein
MKNIFDKTVSNEVIGRINMLNSNSKPKWGKMTVDQMLAHCNVTYELVFDNNHPKPNGFKKWFHKTFIKNIVVSEKPYKKNSRTGPQFIINTEKNFDQEKNRLIAFVNKTQELGENYFDNKESHTFGNLTKTEWNNMFYKHLDHHLNQFGV